MHPLLWLPLATALAGAVSAGDEGAHAPARAGAAEEAYRRCPEPAEPAPHASFASLEANEAKLRAALESAPPACSALELALGETLLLAGRPRAALAPLTRAVAHASPAGDGDGGRPALRLRALVLLGRAQALDGQPFEALRSLAFAERESARGEPTARTPSGADDPVRAAALDPATLLSRHHVRRGGTAWGAYSYRKLESLEKRLESPRGLAVREGRAVVLGKRSLLAPGGGAGPLPDTAGGRRPGLAALAVGPRGELAVLDEEGTLHRTRESPVKLVPGGSGRGIDADALALGVRDEIYVASRGRVHVFEPDGVFRRTLPDVKEARSVATDAAGRLHVLLAGSRGFFVRLPEGETLFVRAAAGDGYRWDDADVIAADPLGGTYVLARSSGFVWVFDAQGELVGRLEAPEEEPRAISSARAIAAGPAGEVYVLSSRAETLGVFR